MSHSALYYSLSIPIETNLKFTCLLFMIERILSEPLRCMSVKTSNSTTAIHFTWNIFPCWISISSLFFAGSRILRYRNLLLMHFSFHVRALVWLNFILWFSFFYFIILLYMSVMMHDEAGNLSVKFLVIIVTPHMLPLFIYHYCFLAVFTYILYDVVPSILLVMSWFLDGG